MYVMDPVMNRLSERIEAVTNGFADPAQVYAFGIRNVMIAATTDQRWRWVLRRSEAIAGAMYRVMGPYAIRDIRNAVVAGRYCVEDPELAWRQASHAITGFSLLYLTRLSCLQKWTRPWSICSAWWVFAAARPGKLRAGPVRRCRSSSDYFTL